MILERERGLEHGGVIGRLVAREGEIGAAEVFKCAQRIRAAFVPAPLEFGSEKVEPAPRHVRHQVVAVAEVSVGRARAHAGRARGFRHGESCRPLVGDQLERAADQRLAQVAVVIAASALVSRPSHVTRSYMNRRRDEIGDRKAVPIGRGQT